MASRSLAIAFLVVCACSRPQPDEDDTGFPDDTGTPDDTGLPDDTDVPDDTALPEVASGSEVGPEGAIVTGGDGATGVEVEIPAGALAEGTVITVEVASSGYDATPSVAGSPVFTFEPHGQTFAVPVTVRIPHDLTPGEAVMWTAAPGGAWEKLHSTDLGAFTTVDVVHFSFFFNGREVCGLDRQECCAAPDEACAGDLLECVDLTGSGPDVCLPCGLVGEACCGGTTCYEEMTCPEGSSGSGISECGSDGSCTSGCEVIDTGGDDTGSDDTGDTEDPPDSGDTGDTEDPPDSGDSGDTEDPPDSGDTGDTEDPPDSGDTGDTEDPPDSGDTGDTEDPTDTGDTADTEDQTDTGDPG